MGGARQGEDLPPIQGSWSLGRGLWALGSPQTLMEHAVPLSLWMFDFVFPSFHLWGREKNPKKPHTSSVCHVLRHLGLSFRNVTVEDWN